MVPTFVIDTPAIFALGLLTSLFALEHRGSKPFHAVWPFWPGMLACLAAFGTALASWEVAPDWMYMYYFEDSATSRSGFAYLALVLYLLPFVAGFVAGLDLRRRSRFLTALMLVITVSVQAAVMRHVWERYVRVGTLEEWRRGGGVPLPEHAELSRVSALGGGLVALILVSIAWRWVGRRRAWRRGELGVPRYLHEGEERIVAAVAARLFPGEDRPDELARELSAYIGNMVLANRVGLRAAVFALQWLPLLVVRRARRITGLPPADRDAYLRALEHHRNDLLRTCFIIVKTTLSLLYYERPEVLRRIGMDFHCRQVDRPPAFPETPRREATS